jgi:hypothetical protein
MIQFMQYNQYVRFSILFLGTKYRTQEIHLQRSEYNFRVIISLRVFLVYTLNRRICLTVSHSCLKLTPNRPSSVVVRGD